jgi:hypothetical protein
LDVDERHLLHMSALNSPRTLVATAGLALIFATVASASPPTHNTLGAGFKVISKSQTGSTIEIRLKPKVPFDTVAVEAGSGVGSLTSPCSFSDLVVGQSYVCQVSMTPRSDAASATLNVVGQRTVDPARPRVVEVHHFTVANPDFVAPAAKGANRPVPSLISTPTPGS